MRGALNRLRNHFCYLVGAIDRCPNLGQDWRNDVKKELTDHFGVIVYDPLDKPFDEETTKNENKFRAERKAWKEKEQYENIADYIKTIRHLDLRMCDRADFAIVYLDLDIFACGTFEELFWLNRSKKPILIVCKQGKASAPDWLFGTLPHQFIFSSFEEMYAYLAEVNSAAEFETFGRWLFFKY